MKPYGLTSKQREVLDFIRGYIAMNGHAPSHRDVMKAMGFKSPSQSYRIIGCLEQRGYVRRLPDQARSITLTYPASFPGVGLLPEDVALAVADVAAQRGVTPRIFIEEAVRAHLTNTRRSALRAVS